MNGPTMINMHEDPVRYRDGELSEGSAPSLVPYSPFSLRGARITDIKSRSDLVRELTKQIPVNEYGLPTYYYRPDLLDWTILCSSMERGDATFVDEMLQSAILPIWYTEGYPTIHKNTPVWGQMEWESKEAHQVFLQYADQAGIRTLHSIISTAPDLVDEYFHLNYWASRASSLDMFKAAHHARLREHRIMRLEDDHFIAGEKIFQRIVKAIENKTADQLQEMDVDKLISSLEKVSKLQRSAVGLSNNANSGAETPKATSVEVTMRQVSSENKQDIVNDAFDTSLLTSPELIEAAQELIIKVNK